MKFHLHNEIIFAMHFGFRWIFRISSNVFSTTRIILLVDIFCLTLMKEENSGRRIGFPSRRLWILVCKNLHRLFTMAPEKVGGGVKVLRVTNAKWRATSFNHGAVGAESLNNLSGNLSLLFHYEIPVNSARFIMLNVPREVHQKWEEVEYLCLLLNTRFQRETLLGILRNELRVA